MNEQEARDEAAKEALSRYPSAPFYETGIPPWPDSFRNLFVEGAMWALGNRKHPEPEWEYGCGSSSHRMFSRGPIELSVPPEEHEVFCASPAICRRTKAGPWEPVD